MRLHDYIASHRDNILEEWVVFAQSCSPAAEAMDVADLRDHASEMIDAIVADLRVDQTSAQQNLKALGQRDAPRTIRDDAEDGTAAQSHGAGRARSGFTIEQMVSEYRALRASVLRLWFLSSVQEYLDETEDLMRFNEAIDQALAESVASFARVVAKALTDARSELEMRVADRTHELTRTNEALATEIRERERAEKIRIQLLQRLVNAQENEQRRIARELHDQLGQQITALHLKIRALRGYDDLPPHLGHELENIEQVVKQLDNDVDLLVWQVRPAALDGLGLVDAIGDYVKNWTANSGISGVVHLVDMEGKRLSDETETVLFRVTQEALNNVAKHARAHNVLVQFNCSTDEIVLSISDDGAGFDLKRQRRDSRKHLGLDGMRERCAMVGGTVTIESRPGEGTAVLVRVPLARGSERAET